mmetsp:Transcript_61841/g.109830  ORF Transcript_61841/g.109830 Transcript_61841/m.109830 type:complete len:413 (-) Transcript_61841:73-1311(-)
MGLSHLLRPLLALLATAGAVKHKKALLSACSCSCCETQARAVALRSKLKCSPLVAETSGCTGECQDLKADVGQSTDMVMPEEGAAADYALFCLQRCHPSDDEKDRDDFAAQKRVSLPCKDLSEAGDGKASNHTAKAAESPAVVALMKGASAAIEETGALVADAEGKKAAAMAAEAEAAVAEASAAAARARAASNLALAQSRGDLSNEVKAALKESAERAGFFAKTAEESAATAAKELKELEEVPKMAAKEASAEAVKQVKAQDAMNHQVMDTLEANISPPPPPPPYEAAGRAAEPYASAISTATDAESMYEAQATALTDQADMLRTSAMNVVKQAEPYEEAGRKDLAKIIQKRAEDISVQAANLDTKAVEASSKAAHIEVALPKYGAAAGTAVARANILGQQKWMPPPPATA